MYTIEEKSYGYRLTFGDFINTAEMKEWVDDSRSILLKAPKEFGVFVDMRTLKPLPQDAQVYMQEGQKLYRQQGMVRSVVILNNPVTKMQFIRLAKETGIYNWERYIDASSTPDWETAGINWISNGIDLAE